MLDYAINHIVPLQIECLWAQENPDNRFFFLNRAKLITLSNSREEMHEFVSVGDEGKILGFIRYSIFNNSAINLELISFEKNSSIFSKDLIEALKDIFDLYKLNRVSFSASLQHPLLNKYKNIIKKFNGKYRENKKNGYVLFELKKEDYKNYKKHK